VNKVPDAADIWHFIHRYFRNAVLVKQFLKPVTKSP
jgi:hypothetical protein